VPRNINIQESFTRLIGVNNRKERADVEEREGMISKKNTSREFKR
jgi:hypothetical protein